MSKKVVIVAVIAIVLISSAGIALVFFKTGNEGSNGTMNDVGLAAPKDAMQEFVRSVNAKDYSSAVNTTVYNFSSGESKGNVTTAMRTSWANYSMELSSLEDFSPESQYNDAIQSRMADFESSLPIVIDNWSVLKMSFTIHRGGDTKDEGTYYALFFEIGGKWYLDRDSVTSSIASWKQRWEKQVSLYFGMFDPTSKHRIGLGISGSTDLDVTIDRFKVIVSTSDVATDNSASFVFSSIGNGSISSSPDWTATIGNNLKIQANALSWIDWNNNGHVDQNDRIAINLDRYVPGTNYSFDLVYLTKNTTYGGALNVKLFDYIFPPTMLNIQMTQMDANSYKFVQVSKIPQDNAVSKIKFFMGLEGNPSPAILILNESGVSRLTPGLFQNPESVGITEDCVTFHDVDGDGYVSQGDYFTVTFMDGWNTSKNYLWVDDGTYQSIFNYYW